MSDKRRNKQVFINETDTDLKVLSERFKTNDVKSQYIITACKIKLKSLLNLIISNW